MLLRLRSVCLFFLSGCFCSALVVVTPKGSVSGARQTSRRSRVYHSFTAIPYAKPPLAELRFKNPVENDAWEGVLDGSGEMSPLCLQRENPLLGGPTVGTEDCLYLNVYTHNVSGKAAVMFFVHGGAFAWGHPGPAKSSSFLMDKDIVLVTVAYRLGPLGFLTTEDTLAPGNFGLKDQAMALHWVKKNIEYFGGDPNSITVFGFSVGGASAHYLMVSPLTKDLVTRGISESGTIAAFWASGRGLDLARRLAASLGCPPSPSGALLACMRRLPARNITAAQYAFTELSFDMTIKFRPVVEEPSPGAFLTSHPEDLSSDKPWMAGTVTREGAPIGALYSRATKEEREKFKENLDHYLPIILGYFDRTNKMKYVNQKVKERYFEGDTLTALLDSSGDSYFYWPFVKGLKNHRGPSYAFQYNHRGCVSFTDDLSPKDFGVSHADEVYVLFNTFPMSSNRTTMCENDIGVSEKMVELWTNFARFGDPTPSGSGLVWKESENGLKQLYMNSDAFVMSPISETLVQNTTFWDSLPISADRSKPHH